MNKGGREWYEFLFKKYGAEKGWELLLESNKQQRYMGQRACAETVYREIFGRLPGELSPEEELAAKKKMIAKLQAEIEEAEAEPIVDPVKDVPVEPVVEEKVMEPVVEEVPQAKKRGRKPNAMTLDSLQPK